MQRLVTTYVGVTERGLHDIQLAVAEQKRSLTDLGEVFSTWASKTAKQINDRLDETGNAAMQLAMRVQKQDELIHQDLIPRLVKLESHTPSGEGTGFIPKLVTREAMGCIRVLAQVQDLVTDKDFVLKTNNETLKKIQGSEPYKTCVEKIKDEHLKAAFTSAFAEFKKGEHEERSERLLLIQRLNTELIQFFAPRPA